MFIYLAVSYDFIVMIVSSIVLLHNVFTLDVKKLSAPANTQRKYSATCHIGTLGFTATSLKVHLY